MTSVRDRLLDATERLVYRHGVNGVGIDRILVTAKVAKMSLYQHFDGKEALILAMLERRHHAWMAWFGDRTQALGRRSAGPIAAIFDALAEWFARPDFHGCAFINCAAEFDDPKHPIRRAARRHKEALQATIADICRAGGVDRELSPAIYLLVEGAIVAALVNGGTEPARAAKRTALYLVDVRHSRRLR